VRGSEGQSSLWHYNHLGTCYPWPGAEGGAAPGISSIRKAQIKRNHIEHPLTCTSKTWKVSCMGGRQEMLLYRDQQPTAECGIGVRLQQWRQQKV
jgi:hypothetical protein